MNRLLVCRHRPPLMAEILVLDWVNSRNVLNIFTQSFIILISFIDNVINQERFLFPSWIVVTFCEYCWGSYLLCLAAVRVSPRYLTNLISSASSGLSSEIKSAEYVFRNGREALRLCALHFSHSLEPPVSRPWSGPGLQKTFYSHCIFRMAESAALLD